MTSPHQKPLLLIVDGSADHLQQLSHLLEDRYAVRAVQDCETAQALAQHLQTEREKYRVLIDGTDIRPE